MQTYDNEVVDLFAGPGGWSLACQRLGLDEIGVEFEKNAVATREEAGFESILGSVTDFGPENFPKARGLIASPPCQTFSMAGKGAGRKALDDVLFALDHLVRTREIPWRLFSDERTGLVLEPMRWILQATDLAAYRWVALEQVPTVQPVWDAYAEVLSDVGYSVATGRLQAEQYGVPQTRKRSILIASLDHEVSLPTPTHSRYYSRNPQKLDPGVEKWVSMAEALGWGMTAWPSYTVTGGGAATGGAEPFGNMSRQGMKRELGGGRWLVSNDRLGNSAVRHESEPAPTITGGNDHGNRKWVLRNNSSANACGREVDKPARTLYFGQRSNFCEWQSRPIESQPADTARPYHRPSTTIVGSFKPEVVAAPGYRTTVSRQNAEGSIKVTQQEAAVLQSFPHDFPWQGSKSKQFQQIGNAIPPLLAQHIIHSVMRTRD